MASDSDPALRRVPSLVSYCQRVLSAHADAITCLGDDVRYDVIKPVLECCSADTLLRLEQSSPYLEQDTSGTSALSAPNSLSFTSDSISPDLWERLCFKSYPLLAEQLSRNADQQPESWRDQYFLLREAEANRLEEVASRLRNQRMEAAERKREREVKLTDRLPPAKRSRAWGAPSQPKTLFQKTKSEVTKLRRSMYTPRLPPQLPGKVHRPTTASPLLAPSTKPVNGQINVNSVTIGRPSTSTPPSTPHRAVQSKDPKDPVFLKDPPAPPQLPAPAHSPSQAVDPRPTKPPIQKRDPMASLFMPKHRALSQLPSQASSNNRTVPQAAR